VSATCCSVRPASSPAGTRPRPHGAGSAPANRGRCRRSLSVWCCRWLNRSCPE
jgi:hypothetical protein